MANPTYPANVTMSVYATPPPPAAVTVSNVAGLPTSAVSGDAIIRSADMSLWDSTHSVYVRPEQTNQPIPND